jgi:hypothetical protein
LCADSDGGVHQFAIVVVEIVFESYAIGVFESDGLEALLIVVGINDEFEIARLYLCFVEHPFVEEQILIAGGGHHKGNGAALGTGNRFARLVYGLVKFVNAFHHAVCFFTYGKVALKSHDVVILKAKHAGGRMSLPPYMLFWKI